MTPPHSKILDQNSFVQYDPLLHDPFSAISLKKSLINSAIKHNIPYTTDLYAFHDHREAPNTTLDPRLPPTSSIPLACVTHHYSAIVLRLRSGKTLSYDTRFSSLRIAHEDARPISKDQHATPAEALQIMTQQLILETI